MFQQVMQLGQSPAYRLALAERLEQERHRANNGTIPGGLASMVNIGTASYLRNKDKRDREAAQAAFVGGAGSSDRIGTPDGQQPNAPQIAPGYEGAEARLSALDGNAYAGRLSMMLAMEKRRKEEEAAQLNEQRAWQAGLVEDDRNFRREMLGKRLAGASGGSGSPKRQTAKAADGYLYYLDTGKRVFPNAKAPPGKSSGQPSIVQQYEYARSNGYEGSILDYQKELKDAGRDSTNINVNTGTRRQFHGLPDLPRGYDYARGPDGAPLVGENGAVSLVPLAGGPQSLNIAEKEAKKAAKTAGEVNKTGLVLEDIGRFREKIKTAPWYSPVTGLGGALLASIPGSGAYNTARISDTIRANIGFDRLQQMRDESPTGGALGAVNNQEMQLLQSVLGSLDQAQDDDQLLYNLERLDGIYRGIMRKLSAYPNAGQHGLEQSGDIGSGITAAPSSDSSVDDLIKKYGG